MPDEPTSTSSLSAAPPGSLSGAPSVAAVIVTRNRLALLQESLAAVRSQTRPPDEILVIDNDSDDGTREWLGEQSGLTVIRQGNLGGAGGFWRGIKEGYERGHDWLWCMDDDTIAGEDALQRLCEAPPFGDAGTGYLGSLVKWTDGSPHKMNMWLSLPTVHSDMKWYGKLLSSRCVPSETSSFVSILISRRAVEKVGLPIKEMFIWCDDAEYTYRISGSFENYHVLDSIALHKTRENKAGTLSSIRAEEYFKLRHGLRNEVYFRRQAYFGRQGKKGAVGTAIGTARLAFHMARQSTLLLKNRAPLFLLRALWSGLLFNPRVERVRPAPSKSAR